MNNENITASELNILISLNTVLLGSMVIYIALGVFNDYLIDLMGIEMMIGVTILTCTILKTIDNIYIMVKYIIAKKKSTIFQKEKYNFFAKF